ncbi:hypothetical protein UY3_11722 [Chelonia mydas]|uniref:Uncharacterized protein n=1 Tax=Chelonia mydas TaxID=8469 RepID=M7BGB6_CHEMY|nr:hypothetical protein UY3_11722 [Chelonia mydas]
MSTDTEVRVAILQPSYNNLVTLPRPPFGSGPLQLQPREISDFNSCTHEIYNFENPMTVKLTKMDCEFGQSENEKTKASKTNQGEEHIKNQEYSNMSSEGSSGVSISYQPEAQIQLPTEETVSPNPKGRSQCLSVKVFSFIEVTKDDYWCTSCKKAYTEGTLSNAIIEKEH